MPRFVSCLESAIDGTRFDRDQLLGLHEGRPLWVRYDLDAIGQSINRNVFQDRAPDLWRYRELLPVGDEIEPVSFGEGMSPLIACPKLANRWGMKQLWVKDESQLPRRAVSRLVD